MARKARIEFEGALYHVITRGNQKQKVFRTKEDFQTYLDILLRYKDRHRFSLYAYVLMNNHIHLLIETASVSLSKTLQGVNQTYTMYFNRKYRTVGHLFQGRYKAILCEKDTYLLALVKYIHLNPVRATLTQSPDSYPWSSHGVYMRPTAKEALVDTRLVLPLFSKREESARKLYRSFMGEEISITREDVYRTIDQRLIGSSRFVEEIIEKQKVPLERKRRKHGLSLSEIARGIERAHGVTLKDLRSKSRVKEVAWCRKLLSIAALEYGYRGKEVAAFVHKDPAMISRHVSERAELAEKLEVFLLSIEEE